MSSDSYTSSDLCKGTKDQGRSQRLHPGRGKTQAWPGLSVLLSAALSSLGCQGREQAWQDALPWATCSPPEGAQV